MEAVTVSPKFQVVIPKEVRESLEIESGQKVQVLIYRNRIELIPLKPLKAMKGFLKGISTVVPRDKDRIMNIIDSSGWLSLKFSKAFCGKKARTGR